VPEKQKVPGSEDERWEAEMLRKKALESGQDELAIPPDGPTGRATPPSLLLWFPRSEQSSTGRPHDTVKTSVSSAPHF